MCCGHGGLIIYLYKDFTYNVRNDLYQTSDIWEGLFIDITGQSILNKLTLGNIYKPPKNNNNNTKYIADFISEITPILHTLTQENSYAILVGDFNIDLLKLNER